MEKIEGFYNRTLSRDEKSGYTTFTLKTNHPKANRQYKTIICEGIVPLYPYQLPLLLEGEFGINPGAKTETLHVKSSTPMSSTKELMSSFLSSSFFDNIGIRLAKQIVETTGEDIFEFVKREDAVQILSAIPHMSEEKADILIKKLCSIVHLSSLVTYIASIGGNYFNVLDIYDKYGETSEKLVKENPYLLIYANIPFHTCEALARKNCIPEYNPNRIRALLYFALLRNRKSGNTRIEFNNLMESIHNIEKKANMGYQTSPYLVAAEILKEDTDYVAKYEGESLYVYHVDDYENESSIVENIKRIQRSAIKLENNKMTIEDVENNIGISYGEKQKEAFQALKTSGIKIIRGGPGTGKTTWLNGALIKYMAENPKAQIMLCAPTGCAAKKMEESTKRPAQTIHSMLDIKPYGKHISTYNRSNPLIADFIVVDEASMLDSELTAFLLAAAKNGALIVFLGDIDQLPSVGPGNVLHDLIECKSIEVYELDCIFRQATGDKQNHIIENSQKIKNGDCYLINRDNFIIRRYYNEDDMKKAALDYIEKRYKETNGEGIKVYSPAKNVKFKCGTINLNAEIKEAFNPSINQPSVTIYGRTFSEGDKVIFQNNNYRKGYWNGDEGIIEHIQIHSLRQYVIVKTEHGEITLTGSLLDDIDLSYAITAHKSQGSECEEAVILVPKNPKALLERSVLYVEVTRAKKNVVMFVENDALKYAISNCRGKNRQTGLLDKLQKNNY